MLSGTKEQINELLLTQINVIKKNFLNNERDIYNKQCLVNGLEGYIKFLKEDINQEFTFDPEGTNNQLQSLNKEICRLKKLIEGAEFKLFEAEQEKIKLEDALNNCGKKQQLNNSELMAIKKCRSNINEANTKQTIINSHLNRVKEKSKILLETISEATKNKNNLSRMLQELHEFKDHTEHQSNKNQELVSKIKNYKTKIISSYSLLKDFQIKYNTNLVLPNIFENLRTSALHRKLKELQADLKKLEAKYQRDAIGATVSTELILERFKKLERHFTIFYLSFSRFLEWVHNAIEARIESASGVFSELYRQISPNSEGFLFADDDGSSRNWPVLPNISGINICVSFRGGEDVWDFKNLSLGQKICIFLALRLSFARVTSVPLFFLDEIDVALSSDEKQLIQEMFQSFGNAVQIFSSAHSLNAVSGVSSIYSVEMEGMRSTVKKISTTEASQESDLPVLNLSL